MLHYATLGTNDLARARAFYDPTLAALGYVAIRQNDDEVGYGSPGGEICRLWVTRPFDQNPATKGNGAMLALAANSRAAVDAFHTAGLASGGTDEGKPGLRYRAHFYACYLRDPDGNKLSAVCEATE